MRINHLQEGGPDGGSSRRSHVGPLTGIMTKTMEEEE